MAGTRNWSEAIERAKRHPVGQFSDTHGSTLKSLAEAGISEKLSDGLYYLTDKGWGEDKPAESKVEQGAEKERSRAALEASPQRAQFDSALRVLLMRENLDGTEWAIRQLRESADAAAQVAAEDDSMRLDKDLMWMTLRVAADELEKLLDKRAAELATKGN
jgi:hypothetical protein